jgi:hypothetical protein
MNYLKENGPRHYSMIHFCEIQKRGGGWFGRILREVNVPEPVSFGDTFKLKDIQYWYWGKDYGRIILSYVG